MKNNEIKRSQQKHDDILFKFHFVFNRFKYVNLTAVKFFVMVLNSIYNFYKTFCRSKSINFYLQFAKKVCV